MHWKGKRLSNAEEILEAVCLITHKAEADAFMAAYVASGVPLETARKNIGFIAGYAHPATMKRICRLFETRHPIFSIEVPSHEEAFELGAEGRLSERQED